MDDIALTEWFDANRQRLETAYLAQELPWQQSGFGINTPRSAADWEHLRRPIAESLAASGTWLDVGCANGYLIACVERWCAERGLAIIPFGVDISPALIDLARRRLPQHVDRLFIGNIWDWQPPQRFDAVSLLLEFVPPDRQSALVRRVLADFLVPGGTLLVAEYGGGRNRADPELHLVGTLTTMGFTVAANRTAMLNGIEMTSVAVIHAAG